MVKISNERNRRVIAENAETARSIISRLVGVIGRREFSLGTALLIPGCRQVHTFFVRFPIDLIFVDSHGITVGVLECVPPYGITGYFRKASFVIELPAGTVRACDIRQGDHLLVEDRK